MSPILVPKIFSMIALKLSRQLRWFPCCWLSYFFQVSFQVNTADIDLPGMIIFCDGLGSISEYDAAYLQSLIFASSAETL